MGVRVVESSLPDFSGQPGWRATRVGEQWKGEARRLDEIFHKVQGWRTLQDADQQSAGC